MKPLQTKQSERALLLDVPLAAETLGVGQSLVWRMIRSGELPVVRLGRAVRIPRRHIEALASGAQAEGAV